MGDERREFCEVIDWDAYQYTDTRKVRTPPWRWFRVQMTLLRSPEWLALSKPARADFIALLGAASETGNLIPMDRRWLNARQLSRSSVEKMSNFGLCRTFFLEPDDKKIRALRAAFSGVSPPPEAEAETETETETDGDRSSTVDRASTTDGAVDRGSRKDDLKISLPSPAPTYRSRTGQPQSVREAVGKKNGHDRRPFDAIKSDVLAMANRLKTSDPEQIHKLAGQTLRVTQKQIAVAIDQLTQDGDL